MIYTVTLNPSLDYIVSVDRFKIGAVNRTTAEIINPGGKGINVSILLKNLGYTSCALGFMAGFTGDEIASRVDALGIESKFIRVKKGLSRINVKLRSEEESEINGMGPDIEQEDIESLYRQLDEVQDGDILILAGAIPAVLPKTMYRDIMTHLQNKKIRIVVDATKDLLTNVLEYGPFLIKPNNFELGEIFGVELRTREEVVPYARKMQEKGARNVLVSMAGEGAVLVSEDGDVFMTQAPKGKVRNSVGAGDSMVAGFLAEYLSTGDYEKAFYMGVCAGSASAFSEGMATKEKIQELLTQLGK